MTDLPPGLYGQSTSRKFNIYDQREFEKPELDSVFSESAAGNNECNTTKDKYESAQHTGGILAAVMFCGVVVQIRELYRSEGKQQVALFLFDLIGAYARLALMMPIVLCYDDACHLLARLLSLMGTHWQAALAVCLILSLDGFHKVNHVAAFCVGALNPKTFLQIQGKNTQACEQTNRWLNKHRYLAVCLLLHLPVLLSQFQLIVIPFIADFLPVSYCPHLSRFKFLGSTKKWWWVSVLYLPNK